MLSYLLFPLRDVTITWERRCSSITLRVIFGDSNQQGYGGTFKYIYVVTAAIASNNNYIWIFLQSCTIFFPFSGMSTHLTLMVHATGAPHMQLYPHFGHGGNATCNLPTPMRLTISDVVSLPPMCCPLICSLFFLTYFKLHISISLCSAIIMKLLLTKPCIFRSVQIWSKPIVQFL